MGGEHQSSLGNRTCLPFRVAIGVVGTNQRALRFYECIGFQREGVQRDGYDYAQHDQDFVMMSRLEDEYRTRRTGRGFDVAEAGVKTTTSPV